MITLDNNFIQRECPLHYPHDNVNIHGFKPKCTFTYMLLILGPPFNLKKSYM